jgi:predicted phage terminase large subunit-like protein
MSKLRNQLLREAQMSPLPVIKALPTLMQIDTEKCKRSFFYFLSQAWSILEPFRKFTPGIQTYAFCEHLQALHEGKITKLVVCMPPRFGKSIILLAFTAWEWITEPWHRYMCISYNESLATEHSQKCRNLILSPWYQERFGSSFKLQGDQNQKQKFENDHTGFRMASGLTGTLGKGGDRLFLDDPMSQATAESEVERKWCLDFYDGTLASRLGYGEGTATVCVMQRLHQADMAAHLLALGFDYLVLPNEYEPEQAQTTSIGWSDPRRQGELLWPDGCGEEATKKLKLSPYYTSQFQQRPVPKGGNLIKENWWRYYDELPTKMDGSDLIEDLDEKLFSWDATFDGKSNSDFVVGQLWGRKGANRYLIDQVRGQWDFTKTIEMVISFCQKHNDVHTVLIENKANGPAIISTLKGKITGLIPVDPKTSKESRIIAVTPEIESGNCYLPRPENAPWIKAFVEECNYYPKGVNDDQIDCAAYALLRFKSFAGANVFDFYRKQTEEILSQVPSSR